MPVKRRRPKIRNLTAAEQLDPAIVDWFFGEGHKIPWAILWMQTDEIEPAWRSIAATHVADWIDHSVRRGQQLDPTEMFHDLLNVAP